MTTTTTRGLANVSVLAHVVRVRALFAIEAGGGSGVSPKQLHDAFGVPLANVAYHIDVMRKARVIDLKRRVPRRGAVEHFYVLSAEGERLVGAARTLGYGKEGAST